MPKIINSSRPGPRARGYALHAQPRILEAAATLNAQGSNSQRPRQHPSTPEAAASPLDDLRSTS